MDQQNFDEYLENRYKKQMEYYSKASAKNQQKYKRFQWILIVLSATTPVLAALTGRSFKINDSFTLHLDLQMFVIIISAIVAILTTGLKTFNYQELWVSYRSTYEMLKPEIYYYNFKVGPYSPSGIDRESMFVSRVEGILDSEHKSWPPARQFQENQNKKNEDGEVEVEAETSPPR